MESQVICLLTVFLNIFAAQYVGGVINGSDDVQEGYRTATTFEFPFIAAIIHSTTGFLICIGTIISPTVIATYAQCFTNQKESRAAIHYDDTDVELLRVVIGNSQRHYLFRLGHKNFQNFRIQELRAYRIRLNSREDCKPQNLRLGVQMNHHDLEHLSIGDLQYCFEGQGGVMCAAPPGGPIMCGNSIYGIMALGTPCSEFGDVTYYIPLNISELDRNSFIMLEESSASSISCMMGIIAVAMLLLFNGI